MRDQQSPQPRASARCSRLASAWWLDKQCVARTPAHGGILASSAITTRSPTRVSDFSSRALQSSLGIAERQRAVERLWDGLGVNALGVSVLPWGETGASVFGPHPNTRRRRAKGFTCPATSRPVVCTDQEDWVGEHQVVTQRGLTVVHGCTLDRVVDGIPVFPAVFDGMVEPHVVTGLVCQCLPEQPDLVL